MEDEVSHFQTKNKSFMGNSLITQNEKRKKKSFFFFWRGKIKEYTKKEITFFKKK